MQVTAELEQQRLVESTAPTKPVSVYTELKHVYAGDGGAGAAAPHREHGPN
jgi:hypothetical protein